MATVLLGILVFSWGEIADIMSVPHMVKTWQNGQKEDFKKIASGYMSFILLGFLLLAFMVYTFSHQLSSLPIGFDPQRKALLTQSLPWLLPVVILYVLFPTYRSRFALCATIFALIPCRIFIILNHKALYRLIL